MTREARQVLAELELISHGKATSWDSSGASETTAVLPQGESRPPHEYWRGRFNDADSDYELADLVRQARGELDAWKVRQEPAEDCWNERDAILKDGQGFEASVVARRFARTTSYIRRVRLKDNRDSEYGIRTTMPATRAESKATDRIRVLNLVMQGCTLRQIEMQTDVPRETVRRWMKEAA